VKKLIVLKIGTSTIIENKIVNKKKIRDIIKQIIELESNYNVILICSGAVECGREYHRREECKRTLASIGQIKILQEFKNIAKEYKKDVAQILVNKESWAKNQLKKTINNLIHLNKIIVINENDVTKNIKKCFSSNDELATEIAILMKSDILILGTDVDGVYNKNPKKDIDARLIKKLDLKKFQQFEKNFQKEIINKKSTGGIYDKIKSAFKAINDVKDIRILNAQKNLFLILNMLN